MDLKSINTTLPTDAFAAGFAGISGQLVKLTIINQAGISSPKLTFNLDATSSGFDHILEAQDDLLEGIKQALKPETDAVKQYKAALQPIPGDVCAVSSDRSAPWNDPVNWRKSVISNLKIEIDKVKAKLTDFPDSIDELDKEIIELKGSSEKPADYRMAILNKNQDTLRAAVAALGNVGGSLEKLRDAVQGIESKAPGPFLVGTIQDLLKKDGNSQSEQWVVNASNDLLLPAKAVVATNPPDSYLGMLAGLTDAPVKTAVVTVTVQYQSTPRFEISSGLMVPFQPYHSYAVAALAKNGAITGDTVQESHTYTVIPMATFNILLGRELIANKQRVSFFATGAVGYNPATSSVEFGVGPSFSWRSIVISGLVDIGRDTELTGGFKADQVLDPKNLPSKLPTKTVWGVKGAAGISVRIPLGGGSK